jgi:hypothetical protein
VHGTAGFGDYLNFRLWKEIKRRDLRVFTVRHTTR